MNKKSLFYFSVLLNMLLILVLVIALQKNEQLNNQVFLLNTVAIDAIQQKQECLQKYIELEKTIQETNSEIEKRMKW